MAVAPVIHIGGWPGAGKRTIGRIVADRLGGRLIHNHLMLDAARAIYARDTSESVAMREEVRGVILAHAALLPKDISIILTDALAEEPASVPLFQPTLDFAHHRGATLRAFVLDMTYEENARRLMDPSRVGGDKLMDIEVLRNIRQTNTLFVPEGAVVLDVTDLSAEDVAAKICQHLECAHA